MNNISIFIEKKLLNNKNRYFNSINSKEVLKLKALNLKR